MGLRVSRLLTYDQLVNVAQHKLYMHVWIQRQLIMCMSNEDCLIDVTSFGLII